MSDPTPSRRYQNLTRAEIQRIEERFRRRRLARSTLVEDETVKANRKRDKRIVWGSFCLTAIVIALIAFLQKPPPPPEPKLVGAAVPDLGPKARLPMGAREVTGTHLAYTPGLAPGSEEAAQRQLETAEQTGFPVEIENSVGMRFRLIPKGEFTMGTPADDPYFMPDETQHEVVIARTFYMGVYEVTQRQWTAVMGAGTNPSSFTSDPDLPVESVSWNHAIRFCKKLAAAEGLPEGAYRLATEEEWEYACRAGTTTPFHVDSLERLPLYADYADNNYRSTRVVGQRLPNAWGLHNMHGNVWEWCMSPWTDFETDEVDSRFRCLRGGNWRIGAADCRSASRGRYTPSSSGSLLGFRLVRVLTRSTVREPTAPADSDGDLDGDGSDSDVPLPAEAVDVPATPATYPESTDQPDVDPQPPEIDAP